MPGQVSCTVDQAIAVVTIDNSARLNAIDLAIATGLAETTRDLAARADVNVVVIRGAGTRAFSAGVDLKAAEASGNKEGAFEAIDVAMRLTHRTLAEMAIPSVAMVSGVCYGGGVQLASMTTFRIASDDLKLAIPAIPNRLFYPVFSLERLAALMGWPATRRLIYDGGPHDAATLLGWGFLDRVVPAAEIESGTMAFAQRLAGKPREIVSEYGPILAAIERGDHATAEGLRDEARARELSRKRARQG